MSNVEQEADNSKRNSEESDVVLKIQQMLFALITSSRNRGKSSRKHLKPTTGQPAASISSPAQPVASYSAMYIQSTWYPDARKAEVSKRENQTQATAHPVVSYNEPAVALCIQSQRSRRNDRIQQKRKAVVDMNQRRSS
ncbi:hypothetical protein F511_30789 [Dorcoceras hygrometricum]|uniref:Uncharacterized protein n=1 Tax=Dorcoceras hygrometricum TaxID=472368 RepID=A0A2Z7AF72_9LAMI|nr:hypothetical protein F511_30789 [Dorcoceras hygrometricum]